MKMLTQAANELVCVKNIEIHMRNSAKLSNGIASLEHCNYAIHTLSYHWQEKHIEFRAFPDFLLLLVVSRN